MTESRQTEMKDYALLQQELEAAVIDTELKKCGEINFSIGWLKSFRDIFNSLLTEHESLLRQYQKLREAVCVLEDGAEPEVGDDVKWIAGSDEWFSLNTPQFYLDKWKREYPKIEIFRRNGTPCVYRSELEQSTVTAVKREEGR